MEVRPLTPTLPPSDGGRELIKRGRWTQGGARFSRLPWADMFRPFRALGFGSLRSHRGDEVNDARCRLAVIGRADRGLAIAKYQVAAH